MKKKVILTIDDEQDSLEFLKSILEDDYEVHSANDGDIGLDKARELLPDCIILDVQMPKQDGFVTLWEMKRIKELEKIPVIMLTGVGEKVGKRFSKEEVGDLVGAPPDHYVEKPVDPQKLLSILKTVFKD
jgi:two-component system, OmpR family, alkaline phosphatase synthesis response regulator PhoP